MISRLDLVFRRSDLEQFANDASYSQSFRFYILKILSNANEAYRNNDEAEWLDSTAWNIASREGGDEQDWQSWHNRVHELFETTLKARRSKKRKRAKAAVA